MSRLKFSTNPAILGPLGDRFESRGYKEEKSADELFEALAGIEVIEGMDFWGPGQVTLENADEIGRKLKSKGLKPASLVVDLWSRPWGQGSFAAKDKKTRIAAVRTVKNCLDIATKMGIEVVTVWFGQDGVDYPFEADFIKAWDWIVEGMQEAADHKKDIKIGIEYKIKEPRIHEFIGTVGDTLLLIKDIGKENVGVTLDVGHSLAAGENMAYATARILKEGKLFATHWGDNYGTWDDDVIVGMVNPIRMFEVVYWLDRYDWEGWCAMDQYPFRSDGIKAVYESISWIKGLMDMVHKIGRTTLDEAVENGIPGDISKILREAMLG